ncbi:unnamed protein product [Moneuplotes crassus]|uniref:C2H2-type domain-containing protein n=1 Tax=Euplotes crassus TaxID=5936 RepID=A0AAD1XCI0_EUPCR|nr:unnamed protein product [Moneuplotes crassus]
MNPELPLKHSKTLYLPVGISRTLPPKTQGLLRRSALDHSQRVQEYFHPFRIYPNELQLTRKYPKKLNFEEIKKDREVIVLDSPERKIPSERNFMNFQNKQNVFKPSDLEVLDKRNILIEERHGVKYVKNSQGREFVYYENLEQVRNILKYQFPGMTKDSMYKELLRPYRHKVVSVGDIVSGSFKQVYQCGYSNCTKQFSKTWNLVDHLRMHEGIKPYKCHICYKLFTQKGNLQKHLKQHVITDVEQRKKFRCDYCGKGYTERYNCVAHMRKHCRNS